MDSTAVESFVRRLIRSHESVFRQINGHQPALLELAVFLGAKEHYRSKDYQTEIRNPRGGGFVVKTKTQGHPSKYSHVFIGKNGQEYEAHMNLAVRSAHDNGIYCVDIGVTRAGVVPRKVSKKDKWVCLRNQDLVTFAETKKLPVYPMLLAQFVGIVHEITPQNIGLRRKQHNASVDHFPPALVTLGHLSGNSRTVVDAYAGRNIRITIVTDFDTRLAVMRRGSTTSPFAADFFEIETPRALPADTSAVNDEALQKSDGVIHSSSRRVSPRK